MALPSNLDNIQQMIVASKTDAARHMLKNYLQRTPSDPHGWWLFAQVAENQQQRYFILEELLKLPTNQYTVAAKAILSRLPYQHPSTNPLPIHASDKHLSTLLLIGGLSVALVIVLVSLFMLSNRQQVAAASAMSSYGQAQAQNTTLQPTQERIIVTLERRSTETPLPTSTILPTRTPRPTFTPVPRLPTATATLPPDLTELVPPLYAAFSDKVTSMKKAADETSSMLNDATSVSIGTLAKVTDQVDNIRKIRNQITFINLRVIPLNIRREVILPAHNAFINYINAYLTLLDEQIVSAKLYQAAMQPDVEDFDTAFKLYQDQAEVVAKKAAAVKSAYETLITTMRRYQIYAVTEQVKGIASGQVTILSGATKGQTLTLKAGIYSIFSRSSSAVSLKLRSVNDHNRVFEATGDANVFNIPSGKYQIEVGQVEWWILAIDPA